MNEDRELLREIWNASLPIVFKLSPDDENHAGLRADPYYVSVPETPPTFDFICLIFHQSI